MPRKVSNLFYILTAFQKKYNAEPGESRRIEFESGNCRMALPCSKAAFSSCIFESSRLHLRSSTATAPSTSVTTIATTATISDNQGAWSTGSEIRRGRGGGRAASPRPGPLCPQSFSHLAHDARHICAAQPTRRTQRRKV